MTSARPDIGRRPRKDAEGDDKPQDKDDEGATCDLYGMLGYRAPAPLPSLHSNGWPSA